MLDAINLVPNAGQPDAQRHADQAEHDALGQQLPDDAPAARAERGPHRDLAAPAGGPREQQVGDVGARDEQHERDAGHHQVQNARHFRRQERLAERLGGARSSLRWSPGIRSPAGPQSRRDPDAPARSSRPASAGRTRTGRGSCADPRDTSGLSGTQSRWLLGNAKPGGITPITTWGLLLTRIDCPMMRASPRYRRVQRSWPSSTTSPVPGRSSSALKPRPRIGDVPSIGNKSHDTPAPT